jgi:hypothetical protein
MAVPLLFESKPADKKCTRNAESRGSKVPGISELAFGGCGGGVRIGLELFRNGQKTTPGGELGSGEFSLYYRNPGGLELQLDGLGQMQGVLVMSPGFGSAMERGERIA